METASELFDANDVRNAVMPMPMPTPPITPPISPSSRDSFSRGHGGSSGSPNGDTQNHTREDPLGGPSPDKIAFEYRASTGLVWKRWFWYGPLLLACILIVFLAGPDDCQNLYMAAKKAPQHRAPDFVEIRQDNIFNHQDFLQRSYKYREKDYGDLRTQYDASTPNAPDLDQTASDAANCSEFFLTSLLPQLRSVTVTSPAAAKESLRRYRLGGLLSARATLGPLLTEPVPVAEFVNTMATCTAQNGPLVAWGCELMAQATTTPRTGGGYIVGLADTTNFVTQMMVMDKLTRAAVTSTSFADSMVAAASSATKDAGGADALIDADPMIDSDMKSFVKDKHKTIMNSMAILERYRKVPDSSPTFDARDHKARSVAWEKSVQLNVIEAVSIDWDAGLKDNGYAGLAVAHYTANRGDRFTVSDTSDDNAKSHRAKWKLGKEWADNYIAWNMAFVTSTLPRKSGVITDTAGKLLTPSIICTAAGSSSGLAHDDFIAARIYSLWLELMTVGNRPNYTSPGTINPAWAAGFGRSNLLNLGIPAPTKDEIDAMIKGFAPQTSLWAWVDPGSWRFVQAMVMWGSVNMLGWGGELLSAAVLFAPLSRGDAIDASVAMSVGAAANGDAGVGRTHIKTGYWKLAQLAFPLFLTISVYCRSVFGLPVLCAGLWKFGFPETVTSLVAGHLAEIDGTPVTHLQALGSFLDGLGTVFHHMATSWFVCILVAGTVSESGDPAASLAVSLPLVLQHWLVQFKYVNIYPYTGLLLVSEIWWEIEVIVHVHQFRWWNEQRCLWGMLVAHWLYWLGGIASFVSARNRGGGDDSSADNPGYVRREATMGRMEAVMASRRKSRKSSMVSGSRTSMISGRSIRVRPQSSADGKPHRTAPISTSPARPVMIVVV